MDNMQTLQMPNSDNGAAAPQSAQPNASGSFGGAMPPGANVPGVGMPGTAPVEMPKPKLDTVDLVKTIAIVVLSLVAVTFIGLFIWMSMQYGEASTDLEGQINTAVAKAKDEQANKLEAEFLEREKYPYRTFTGPADYGQLSFEYPKTWSVYVEADASKGGDFRAFFNPIEVNTVNKNTIMALRVLIRDKDYESVVAEFQRYLDQKDSTLKVESIEVSNDYNSIVMNRYTGTIPETDLSGIFVIFKIRDKAAIIQTDSLLFQEDFETLLKTVHFNA